MIPGRSSASDGINLGKYRWCEHSFFLSTASSLPHQPMASSSSDITPLPSSSPPPSTPSSNPSGGGGGGGSIASSASLYRTSQLPTTTNPLLSPRAQSEQLNSRPLNEIAVYTFLATLVLLLSVSAAIVVRSFLLRRRHRRMVEEAIRNGTWMPPPPGNGRTVPRIDLSKKPRMWDLYLDLNDQLPPQQMDEQEWESIKPVMATYVCDSIRKINSASDQTDGGAAGTAAAAAGGGGAAGGSGTGQNTTLFRRVVRSIGTALNPTPSGPQFGQSAPTTNYTGAEQQLTQMTDLGGSRAPAEVRVAVFIAMPRRHPPASNIVSPLTSRPASSGSISQTSLPNKDEEELPLIEMGVVELVVTDSTSMDSSIHHHHHDAKGKMRESIASVGSI